MKAPAGTGTYAPPSRRSTVSSPPAYTSRTKASDWVCTPLMVLLLLAEMALPRLKASVPLPVAVVRHLKPTMAVRPVASHEYTPNLLVLVPVAAVSCTSAPLPRDVPGATKAMPPPWLPARAR